MLVGVIGHVDHGKTALVRALTGMETDRLAEEKRRGISIALGFAHLAIGDAVIDFIDMPGHERFVRTMVSGATGVDTVLLVVAANEGIKPQTIEHLDVAGLLGLQRALVVVSKTDLVDLAQVAATAAAASDCARKAGLAVTGTAVVSALTGQGLDTLRAALLAAIPAHPPAASAGFAYLPVDRVFSVPGHGTVVTGTLRRGSLAVSDPVILMPAGTSVRLRGLQVHGMRAATAVPGQRVAANLRDIEVADIPRGAALTAPGLWPPSIRLTVTLRAVATAEPLPNLSQFMLLFGTEEILVRLRLLDRDELRAGETGLAQLKCSAPVFAPARERFILRRPSPPQTLAGGVVIDPAAIRLRRHAPGVLARLAGLADASTGDIIDAELEHAGPAGVALGRLAQLAGLSESRTAELLQNRPVLTGRSRVAVLRPAFDRVVAAALSTLAAQDGGLSGEQLAAALPWAGRTVVEDASAELVRRGSAVRSGGLVELHRPKQRQERANQETLEAQRLAEALRKGGLSPPDLRSVTTDPHAKRLVDRLVREGVLIRAADKVQKREIVFHHDAIEAAKRQLAQLLANGQGVLVGEAGLALGISRKYCVPLLEYLDEVRFTRRIADRRVLATRP